VICRTKFKTLPSIQASSIYKEKEQGFQIRERKFLFQLKNSNNTSTLVETSEIGDEIVGLAREGDRL